MSVERNYNETFVARLASREKQMQQSYRPVISVHKWFARRPGALFRALALAELVDERVDRSYADGHELAGVCLDAFMGGGTPVFEASRLGLSVLGYDTNPMARWIVERELEDVDPDELHEAGERVAADVQRKVRSLYRTTCPQCDADAEVRYFLWLRHHRCSCGEEHPLLADTMLVSTGLRRHPREVHLCPSCLTLAECRPGKRPARCRSCRAQYDERAGSTRQRATVLVRRERTASRRRGPSRLRACGWSRSSTTARTAPPSPALPTTCSRLPTSATTGCCARPSGSQQRTCPSSGRMS